MYRRDGTGNIKDVISHTDIELGRSKYGGRLHCHTLLEIEHKTRVQVDTEAIKETLKAFMPTVKNPWVWVRFVMDHQKSILKYIRKEEPVRRGDVTEMINTLRIDDDDDDF